MLLLVIACLWEFFTFVPNIVYVDSVMCRAFGRQTFVEILGDTSVEIFGQQTSAEIFGKQTSVEIFGRQTSVEILGGRHPTSVEILGDVHKKYFCSCFTGARL